VSEVKFVTVDQLRVELVAHTVRAAGDMYDPWNEQYTEYGDADDMPVRAARASFGAESKTGKDAAADLKLMKYLADNNHMSPFEHQHICVLVEAPIFAAREMMRHRGLAFNEISARYTSSHVGTFLLPEYRAQATKNRQSSSDEIIEDSAVAKTYEGCVNAALMTYHGMLNKGVAREVARAVLPQSMITRYYASGTLRSWAHFHTLRTDEAAQKELRVIAHKIGDIINSVYPQTWGVLTA
jgi:thymidylate synthase (FAD)